MSLPAIRAGLKTALATTGIDRIYTEDVDKVEAPALVIGNPDPQYDDDFDGNVTYTFPVTLVTGRAGGLDQAVRKLDAYLEPTGAQSVHGAIRAVSGLGGSCASAVVRRGSWGEVVWNDVSYVGITFEVEVMT